MAAPGPNSSRQDFAEAGDAGRVERDFGDGAEDEFGELGGAALGGGVEAAEAFDGVAEQVDADRVGLAGGEEVDDAAAGGVFAGLHDGAGAAVAVGFEEGDDLSRAGRRRRRGGSWRRRGRRARGGTRWTRALTVVSTRRGGGPGSSRRARVAMRSETSSGLGETRS